ncbi:GntR family transcriptional regulator [Siculibacillus lacustris]|uniref:GntR family transcriptional regulator n=2 Tax=Siculibacillus lacustris TaxID=1549641 RepID=A0A4Q9VTY2_9HYPH|nr:GntR family transcriptional regulator [Siculibacillus lacustris]
MKAEELIAGRQTLDGVIYDELRTRIISLDYLPGKMIFENEIAAEFDVSRTPVRRAFFRLAIDDLLQVLPQRGARVSFLSAAKVREAQAVRESLEATAFADVARRWDEADPACRALLAEVEAILADQAAAVDAQDYLAFMRHDEAFHGAFLRFAGNRTLIAVIGEMRAHLNRVRFVELQEAHHDAAALVWHRDILEALRRNDVAATTDRLIAHLKMLEAFRETIFAKRRDMFL